jgi:hypothetical protein
MRLKFEYNLEKEIYNLRCGVGSLNHPQLHDIALEIQALGISFDDNALLLDFFAKKIDQTGIEIDNKIAELSNGWAEFGLDVESRLKRVFNSNLDLGQVTAYLTVADRCGYDVSGRFFFVSIFRKRPYKTCIHELLHFYTHILFEDYFIKKCGLSYADFNDYKEALTVLMNFEFLDIIISPDDGYEKQQTLRAFIAEKWKTTPNIDHLNTAVISEFFHKNI